MSIPRAVFENALPALVERRQIPLMTEITAEIQQIITQMILIMNLRSSEPITILIDCNGGYTIPGLHTTDAINMSKAPVHGLVVGACASMAFWILQNCDRRLSWPNGRMMWHGAGTRIRIDQPNLQETLQEMQLESEQKITYIAKRTGVPIAQWREWSSQEKNFTAAEALEKGLIDEIIYPPD